MVAVWEERGNGFNEVGDERMCFILINKEGLKEGVVGKGLLGWRRKEHETI